MNKLSRVQELVMRVNLFSNKKLASKKTEFVS